MVVMSTGEGTSTARAGAQNPQKPVQVSLISVLSRPQRSRSQATRSSCAAMERGPPFCLCMASRAPA